MNSKYMGPDADGRDARPPATPLLARQTSVYSLTFDEFQNAVGGPGWNFGSMNMDELLRSIWTAEESQAIASAAADSAALPAGQPSASSAAAAAAAIQRQGSLTLPRTLSQKTVDEVWRDLLRESEPPQREPTLGEMTLEEFLVRAGVVREEIHQPPPPPAVVNNSNNNNNATNMFFDNSGLGFPPTTRRTVATTATTMTRSYPALGGNGSKQGAYPALGGGNGLVPGMVGLGGGGGRVTVSAVGSPDGLGKGNGNGNGNGDLSSLSPVPFAFGTGIRGRKCSGAVEKVVERRQRRMIKNRESAARSRARKQAYTMELEAEVAKLKEQNEELQKKQEEIMEMQKNQVMEMINQQRGPKKLCLRRTRTGPW
ncbi:bZIP transcription factor TRAB1-like [Iris pallida]|uniref:BZIP transcription factor TRAB1-like n=1 Tax=Iris pallida TaxID=29817 RepID=A0AAX6F3A6_IRIPA|nr:bZIP transcription factor TRAB1-like [Iris pallida]